MAQITVKTSVTAPSEITIPLVRADHAATSNVFRICFEIFLSLFSSLLGFILGMQNPTNFHWVALIACGFATASFLGLNMYFRSEAAKV